MHFGCFCTIRLQGTFRCKKSKHYKCYKVRLNINEHIINRVKG